MIIKAISEVVTTDRKKTDEVMKQIVQLLSKDKEIRVLDSKINEPQKVEGAKYEAYSGFAEVEIEVKDIVKVASLCINFLFSSVEIIDPPENITLGSTDLSEVLTEFLNRLHRASEGIIFWKTQAARLGKRLKFESGKVLIEGEEGKEETGKKRVLKKSKKQKKIKNK